MDSPPDYELAPPINSREAQVTALIVEDEHGPTCRRRRPKGTYIGSREPRILDSGRKIVSSSQPRALHDLKPEVESRSPPRLE
jgi:hypothetical protein